ncbi:MAG: hypothetical protein H0Z24_05710 [Thermosipho sp. (in: Bacteria)]|nr:hypothetical protein [Thermosipho sp. (in: thermotogales)]
MKLETLQNILAKTPVLVKRMVQEKHDVDVVVLEVIVLKYWEQNGINIHHKNASKLYEEAGDIVAKVLAEEILLFSADLEDIN